MSFRTLSSAVATAFLVLGLAGQVMAQTGRVGGIVRDEDGQPLKGATITADHADSGQNATATSDAKGRFVFIGLRTGEWRFIAQSPGFAPQGGNLLVRGGTPITALTFALRKTGVQNFGPLGGILGKDLQTDLADADALFGQNKWDEAAAAYKNVMQRAPTLVFINLQVAAAYRNKKDLAGALAAYNALLESDPENEKAILGAAAVNMERGDEKAAEEVLLKATERPNVGRDVYFHLGEAKFAKNDLDGAAGWYEKAAGIDPYWGKPLYMLGLCAMKKGDTVAAAKFLDEVVAVDPASAEASLAKSSLQTLKK